MTHKKYPKADIMYGDSYEYAKQVKDDFFDLTFGSPPYEDRRTYGIDFDLKGEEWVDWMKVRIKEFARITKGPVLMVVNGVQRSYNWSATPEKLVADLQREGLYVRKPIIWQNTGMPGSGGPDWFRNNYHTIVVVSKHKGRFPWTNQRAIGAPVKYPEGGTMNPRGKDGKRKPGPYPDMEKYDLVAPGCVWYQPTGGGMMGSKLAHDNEAPFPESLARMAVMSLCPPLRVVFDPFGGSGTTAAAAIAARRYSVSCDIRESQIYLIKDRIEESETRLKHDFPYDTICGLCGHWRGAVFDPGCTWWEARCPYCGEEKSMVTSIRDMEWSNNG